MDAADLATAAEERDRALALMIHHRAGPPAGPVSVGHCLNCEAPQPSARRWCDADCRDDWEKSRRPR